MEFEKVRKIVADQFNINANDINEKTSFQEKLNADSLDILQLINALEDEFGMEFDNDAMKDIRTVGDASEYIKTRLR